MIDQYKHQQLRIGPVSPQQISAWANKILPNGEVVREVTKPYTFHYKTNKPEKDGLFCERIFGPIKSGICACGNYRVIGAEKEDPKFVFIRAGPCGCDVALRATWQRQAGPRGIYIYYIFIITIYIKFFNLAYMGRGFRSYKPSGLINPTIS